MLTIIEIYEIARTAGNFASDVSRIARAAADNASGYTIICDDLDDARGYIEDAETAAARAVSASVDAWGYAVRYEEVMDIADAFGADGDTESAAGFIRAALAYEASLRLEYDKIMAACATTLRRLGRADELLRSLPV
jgi:hypothetical protein